MKSESSSIKNQQQIESCEPKVSIITVVYNGFSTLERTIKSVANLNYSNIEYVIVDGASTDGTLDIIKSYSKVITTYLSEPDNGLYDAMNKGMKLATGDYFWFINSGDEVASSNLLNEIFNTGQFADFYYGQTMIVDQNGVEIGLRRLAPKGKLTWKSFKRGMLVSHQSVIVSRTLCTEYSLKYRFSADYEWVLSALRKSKSVVDTNRVLSRYLDGGLTKKNIIPGLRERFAIMIKNYGLLTTLLHHIPISLNFIYFIVKYRRF
jgi:glycosyltransferase involved in cell wall biosynthesis